MQRSCVLNDKKSKLVGLKVSGGWCPPRLSLPHIHTQIDIIHPDVSMRHFCKKARVGKALSRMASMQNRVRD